MEYFILTPLNEHIWPTKGFSPVTVLVLLLNAYCKEQKKVNQMCTKYRVKGARPEYGQCPDISVSKMDSLNSKS